MGQTRFTLNPKIKPLADELIQITGVDSYSNLLNLLVTKYGTHLKQTWQLLPTATTKTSEDVRLLKEELENRNHDQGIESTDPVINRLSKLIETF